MIKEIIKKSRDQRKKERKKGKNPETPPERQKGKETKVEVGRKRGREQKRTTASACIVSEEQTGEGGNYGEST